MELITAAEARNYVRERDEHPLQEKAVIAQIAEGIYERSSRGDTEITFGFNDSETKDGEMQSIVNILRAYGYEVVMTYHLGRYMLFVKWGEN